MTEHTQYDALLNELGTLISPKNIYTDALRTFAWGTDAGFYRMTPRAIVRSENEKQVAQIIKACRRHRVPYTFRAAGTSLSGQAISDSILIVAGKNWEGYTLAPDHDTIRMQPGLTGGRINRILAPYGRVLPPDPASINAAMIGGIVANNASGMSCGVHANSDQMLVGVRIILADGTILDTGDRASRDEFRKSHPDFISKIERLRDRVRANRQLAELIRHKYSIKNVTGLNLRPLIAYDDPFTIIAHCMVGSEGTLGFLSEIHMRTLRQYPYKASAMVYFHSMRESCEAVVAMKRLLSTDDDLAVSGENRAVKSAEMLDYRSLASVNDPVFLQYKDDVDAGRIPNVEPGDYHNLTAILTETKATTRAQLADNIKAAASVVRQFRLYRPATFTEDAKTVARFWKIRSGIFPSVGGQRPTGTSCLIEDVAFPIEDLPEATVRLQQLIADHGYSDACIYGHALEGNYHFILNQSFQNDDEVARYEQMMRDVARMVVEDYRGSLKAEHGTGRNMAPFVEYEWGKEAFAAMKELKQIFDPDGLLNPGVIFNDDPRCFVRRLKPLPILDFDFDRLRSLHPNTSAAAISAGVERANKCIECGFCEVNCVACGLTLSSRTRIALQRHIRQLCSEGSETARQQADKLIRQYRYYGDATCAADGLCATSCPMGINTGELTHLIRQIRMLDNKPGYELGELVANHFGRVKDGMRLVLGAATAAHTLLGTTLMNAIARALHAAGLPRWTAAMPAPRKQPRQPVHNGSSALRVVYFPSCINQAMGVSKGAPMKNNVVEEMCSLLEKAGYEVVFPRGMRNLCCGQIWESKGMTDIADRKTAELEAALWDASDCGRLPVLCDQSPCLHRMRKIIRRMRLYEPAEFIMTFLRDRLVWHPTDRPVAIHITCSTREMGVADDLIALARLCSTHVLIPEGIGCCAFAGDKGFTNPELNSWALRKLRPQIQQQHIERGYSNSRTCEIGLQNHAGVPYMSIAYLVNEVTTRKNP